MRTVSIGKKTIALAGTILFGAVVFFASLIPSSAPAQAATPQGLLPTVTVSVNLPVTVTLPPIIRTVTKAVKEVVTVTKVLPRQTVRVTLPGQVRTVTLPAQTVTVNTTAQPQQVIKTVDGQKVISRQTVQAGLTGQAGVQTVTLPPVTNTGTPTPAVTTTAKVTEEKIILTRIQAAISALVLAALGALIGLVAYLGYRLGWFRGDGGNREFLEDTVDDLKYNK